MISSIQLKYHGIDRDDLIENLIIPDLEFNYRKFRHFSGCSEFIEALNALSSSNCVEVLAEEIGIIKGILNVWGEWGLFDFDIID